MADVHKNLESSSFEKPSNIVSATICLSSGKLATDGCTNTYTEYFVKGTVPDYCDGHTTLTICTDTGKIANENCPNVETKTYTKKPEKEENGNWRTEDGGKYDVPTETCTEHTTKEVSMPNVVGKNKDDAVKELEKLGLIVKTEYKESKDNVDKVISQDVGSGTKVKSGATVTITVGKKSSSSGSENGENNTEKPSENKENNTVD